MAFKSYLPPSGSRPRWLAETYPEVLRVREDRTRQLYGERHNHCYTSPAYRERVRIINQKLAETFKNHPGVIYGIFPMNTEMNVTVHYVRKLFAIG